MTKPTRRATKTDKLIQNARGELTVRGLNRHRIIPRVIQPPQGGANAPPSGQGFGTTGNFLEPQGDTMVGPIAFFPTDATQDITDPDNPSIDIGKDGEDYSTYVITGLESNKLGTILNAGFDGQLLYLQSVAASPLELINGNAVNLGNILTGTGANIFVDFGTFATLIFDARSTTGAPVIQGAWRVVSSGGGGAGGNAKTGFMLTSTGSTQDVATATSDILNVFDITVIQDGVTVNTTTNTLTIQETGRYIFGLNLTLSADVNNTTADFALVVNGVPLTNVNSVFLRGFGDNDGLYPAAPSDFNAGDTLEISISHDRGVTVTFTFQECGFYLIKQEAGGGGGGGGGATSLGELSDVTLTGPVLDEVLTFDGALWVNKAFPSGGLATDLSNMIAPTLPTVDLSLNGNSLLGVLNVDFDGFGGILGLSNLQWRQTGQIITSLSEGLSYDVDVLQSHEFDVGGVRGIQVVGIGGGVVALELFNNSIDDVKDINFDGNAVIPSNISGIGKNTAGGTPFMEYNVGETDEAHVFSIAGNNRLTVSLSGTLVVGTSTADILQLQAGGSVSFAAGRMRSDGTDVFIFSGGAERNITNVVPGDFNEISQGNTSITILDTGTGSITDIIDGGLVSTKDANNFAIQQNVSFGANLLTGLGNTTPGGTGLSDFGSATLFWKSVFTNQVQFAATTNIIKGDLPFGINYEVALSDNHDFLVDNVTKFRVTGTLLNSTVNLDMGGNDITNVDDITLNGTASILNMNGGDIDMNNGDILDPTNIVMRTGGTLNMSSGNINNVNDLNVNDDITLGDDINIGGDLNHDGTRVGFFGEPPNIRRVVLNPASTTNNDLFTALNNLINALGTINGFGLGLIDTQN